MLSVLHISRVALLDKLDVVPGIPSVHRAHTRRKIHLRLRLEQHADHHRRKQSQPNPQRPQKDPAQYRAIGRCAVCPALWRGKKPPEFAIRDAEGRQTAQTHQKRQQTGCCR